MADSASSGATVWRTLTVVFVILTIGASVCAYTLYSDRQDLASRLETARQASAALQGQLAALQTRVSGQQQQLADQQAQLTAESRPDLPVRVAFRRAFLGQGEVGWFQNLSNRVLEVTLDVTSPATGASLHRTLTMNPRGIVQVGPAQQWAFAPGQKLQLSNPSFRSVTQTVPG